MEKNYLGIDWGRAKIGVALAHAETRLAVAYGVWPVDEHLFPILREVVRLENIGTVILGDPEHADTGNQEAIRKFKEKLEGALGIGVVLQNEMFTSKMAAANLREAGESARSAFDDAEAARILLADWLEARLGKSGK
jgi:putative Holliday junction resolvase